MSNVKLSVTIITYNEEKNIERCLKSVKDIADEIVVVDSFSTDNTKNICAKYNVKFIENSFEGHIEQKNYALSKVKHEHVLSLDANEVLSDELIEAIRKVMSNWVYDGYTFNRLTRFCNKWIKHCGWHPDKKLRLWKLEKGKWGGINPHDFVLLTDDATTGHLSGDLYHYSINSFKQHIDQINFFSEERAKDLFKRGKKFSYLKLIVSPTFKFFKMYVLKAGFLDGFHPRSCHFNKLFICNLSKTL